MGTRAPHDLDHCARVVARFARGGEGRRHAAWHPRRRAPVWGGARVSV